MKPTMKLQQMCPMCDVMLTYEATLGYDGMNNITISAKTTPESTAHVWTHASEGAK